jgi:hypothetical protein
MDQENKNSPERTQAYLAEWLRRHKRETEIAPKVQELHDFAALKTRAFNTIRTRAPREVTDSLQHDFDRELSALKSQLPLPQSYGPASTVILSSTATTTSTNISITHALTDMRADPDPQRRAEVDSILDAFRQLHEQHERITQARNALADRFPHLTQLFDQAQQAVAMVPTFPESASAAATKARTLLDKISGELTARARRKPSEQKIDWHTMASRLCADPALQAVLAEAGDKRARIYADLSDVLKERTASDVNAFVATWLTVVEHVLAVCGSIS